MIKTYHRILSIGFTAFGLLGNQTAQSQNPLQQFALTDLSFSTNPAKNWLVVNNIQAVIEKPNSFKISKGTGVLLNLFDKRNPGDDLLFKIQHGDIDLELDFMMAKSSNSGIYLQGRYEIQLMDSWAVTNVKASDNGGIYERWDESKPAGQQGYEGYSPRQNVSRAPGLWQHLKISFRAPRFDAVGKKTENARILLVELNGVLIQEDMELSGPTRGAINSQEQALGPLRFQGDHGVIAFRNIRYATYNNQRPELSNLKYAVYNGRFETEPDYKITSPQAEGSSTILTTNITRYPNQFLIHYTGVIKINESGEYSFNLNVPGGSGLMRIADKVAVPMAEERSNGKVVLKTGTIPFDLYYSKVVDWAKPSLGLSIAGPGIREFLISDANVNTGDQIDPILLNPNSDNMILRSFMDLDGGKRVTHAINVGSNKQVHYTYDADNGMIVQLWRGLFLNATPMWHDRGDGSSLPAGSAQKFGQPAPAIQLLANRQTVWATDTTGSGFKSKGYFLNKDGSPSFKYKTHGSMVTDVTKVLTNGQGIQRNIEIENPVENLYLQLVSENSIEELGNGRYLINDKSYYLQLEDYKNAKPFIREMGGKKEILVPIHKKISYSILF